MSPAAYAQRDNILATLDCLEEVAHEKIIAHLPALVAHIRERRRNETGDYPPPPDQMKLDAGMADIGNNVLLLKTAQAVRDIQDIEEQEQALALLHPLILEAWQGKLPDVSPEQALDACYNSVYYYQLTVLSKSLKQREAVIQVLMEAIYSDDKDIYNKAKGYLWAAAIHDDAYREVISERLASLGEGSTYSDYYNHFNKLADALIRPLTPEELREIRTMPMDALARDLLERSDYSAWASARRSILGAQLEQGDGDPDCDSIRLMLLSDPSFAFRNKGLIIPPPVREDEATPEQMRTRDLILSYVKSKVDTADKNSNLSWVGDILSVLVVPRNTISGIGSARFPAYGRLEAARILVKMYSVSEGYVKEKAIRTIARIAVLEGDIVLTAIDMVEEEIKQLEKRNPDWANQQWFTENTEPTAEQYVHNDDIRGYEAAHLTLKTLRYRLGAGGPGSR